MKAFNLIGFYLILGISMAQAQYGNPNYSLQNRKRQPPPPCVDEKFVLHAEMIPLNFESGRSTVGEDQIEPVKSKLTSYLTSHEIELVTDVIVTTSSSKAPFYTTVNGKKVLDPQSNEKSLSLAKERATFAEKVLAPLKTSYPKINFQIEAELAGPDFSPTDLNDRFVTKMTAGYGERVEALFQRYKTSFTDQGVVQSSYDLLDEQKFGNLFLVKFKPFHGIRMVIKGHKRELVKCIENKEKITPKPGASKQ
ncbi:hypothetical protein ACJVC5_07395 [Peredibacter sp. HCB2-198]|uniref:hypothetical protein n=1 Tax=Peredibacter sp. HCB2-198 TaxID=3383025 RepID=UPI0038B5EF6D